eukprot:3933405-Rhodomonas_salina.2
MTLAGTAPADAYSLLLPCAISATALRFQATCSTDVCSAAYASPSVLRDVRSRDARCCYGHGLCCYKCTVLTWAMVLPGFAIHGETTLTHHGRQVRPRAPEIKCIAPPPAHKLYREQGLMAKSTRSTQACKGLRFPQY